MTENFMLWIVVVSTIAMIWVISKMYRRWKTENSLEEITTHATVVDKRTSTFRQHYTSHRRHDAMYYITFRTKDGDRVELQVSQAEYAAILADAQGIVTYEGSRLVKFERTTVPATE